jgi:hypothetical protein
LRQVVDRKRFAEKLCELCYAGDVQAMRLLLAYTDGPPIKGLDVDNTEGIQITVNYVQNNRLELAGSTPGTVLSAPTGQTVQCNLLRAPLGKDSTGNSSPDPSSARG